MAITKRAPVASGKSTTTSPTIDNGKKTLWEELSRHIMTGISSMIPFLIMGGLILAFSQLIPYVIMGISPDTGIMAALNSGAYSGFSFGLLKFAQLCLEFGGTMFGFAIPIFTAFMASSIAGKIALPAGFIGGLMATKPTGVLTLSDGQWSSVSPVASGFLGALFIAIFIGYFVKWLNGKIKVSHNMLAFKSTFLIPLISAVTVMIAMHSIITPFGGVVNEFIKAILLSAGKAGEMGYATAMSLATAIDLGGPINKAAGFVQVGLLTEKVMPTTARNIAIVVPSIGLGLATLIDKMVVKRHVFDKQFYPQGKTAMFLAFMGISEGAIPFALEMPKIIIPCYMVGACAGSLTAVMLGAVQWFPESAIWAWPLISGIPQYIIGIAVGSVITAVSVIFWRNKLIQNGKLIVDSND